MPLADADEESDGLEVTLTYSGGLEDGSMHGQGKATFAGDKIYEGQFNYGKRQGHGVLAYPDGRRHEGEWVNDLAHGRGTFFYRSGNRYEGQWHDGKITGQGTLIYAGGDRYEGEWRSGKMHGYGVYTYADGDTYEGEWQDDRRNGKGKLTFAPSSTLASKGGARAAPMPAAAAGVAPAPESAPAAAPAPAAPSPLVARSFDAQDMYVPALLGPWRLRWPDATGRATEIIDVRDPDGFGEMLSFSMLDGVRCVLAPAPGGADAPLAVEWADGTVQTLETFESPLPPSEGDLAAAAAAAGAVLRWSVRAPEEAAVAAEKEAEVAAKAEEHGEAATAAKGDAQDDAADDAQDDAQAATGPPHAERSGRRPTAEATAAAGGRANRRRGFQAVRASVGLLAAARIRRAAASGKGLVLVWERPGAEPGAEGATAASDAAAASAAVPVTAPGVEQYDGQWLQGKMHGFGRYAYPDGALELVGAACMQVLLTAPSPACKCSSRRPHPHASAPHGALTSPQVRLPGRLVLRGRVHRGAHARSRLVYRRSDPIRWRVRRQSQGGTRRAAPALHRRAARGHMGGRPGAWPGHTHLAQRGQVRRRICRRQEARHRRAALCEWRHVPWPMDR